MQLHDPQGKRLYLTAEAEPLLKRALVIDEKALPPDHPYLAIVRNNYAGLLDQLGRADEAAVFRAQVPR